MQFESLPALLAPHVGLLWQELRDRFPKLQQHNAIIPTIERQGLIRATSQIQFAVSPAAVDFRIWMLSEDDHDILQLQPNFFLRNWRRLGRTASDYPSYVTLFPKFRNDYEKFLRFLDEQNLGVPSPNQCELTYVNHIRAGEGWSSHQEFAKVLSIFATKSPKNDLTFETTNASFSRAIMDEKDEFIGRLHVSAATQFTAQRPKNPEDLIINLTLVARGRPSSSNRDGIEEFFDRAHEEIVTTFKAITTSRMHKVWELVDE